MGLFVGRGLIIEYRNTPEAEGQGPEEAKHAVDGSARFGHMLFSILLLPEAGLAGLSRRNGLKEKNPLSDTHSIHRTAKYKLKKALPNLHLHRSFMFLRM